MYGNLALSIAVIAVITASVISITNKYTQTQTQKLQTKQALTYEKKKQLLKTANYAKLDVKPSTLFIADTDRDKILLKKLEKAVSKVITKNPNANDFSCDTLAQTGEITLQQCEKIKNKQLAVIIPSNNGVEESVNNNIETIKNNEKKVIAPVVANTIAVDANQTKEIVINSDKQKTFETPQNQIVKTDRVVELEKKKINTTYKVIKLINKNPEIVRNAVLKERKQARIAESENTNIANNNIFDNIIASINNKINAFKIRKRKRPDFNNRINRENNLFENRPVIPDNRINRINNLFENRPVNNKININTNFKTNTDVFNISNLIKQKMRRSKK